MTPSAPSGWFSDCCGVVSLGCLSIFMCLRNSSCLKLLYLSIAQTYNQPTTPLTKCETLRKRFSPILETNQKRHRTKTIKRRWRWKQFRFAPFFSSFIEKEKKKLGICLNNSRSNNNLAFTKHFGNVEIFVCVCFLVFWSKVCYSDRFFVGHSLVIVDETLKMLVLGFSAKYFYSSLFLLQFSSSHGESWRPTGACFFFSCWSCPAPQWSDTRKDLPV